MSAEKTLLERCLEFVESTTTSGGVAIVRCRAVDTTALLAELRAAVEAERRVAPVALKISDHAERALRAMRPPSPRWLRPSQVTEEGWYWVIWNDPSTAHPQVHHVLMGANEIMAIGDYDNAPTEIVSRLFGPLAPPEPPEEATR